MVKNTKVSNLIDERYKIDKKIQNIQKECDHLTKSLKSIKENVDSSLFICRWVCNECNSVVGIPNPDEMANYLKQ